MGIQVGDNFDHKSKKPLDARTSYATLAQMKAVTDANINEGCFAYCAETDKYYTFKSTNTVDDTLGKWREYGAEEMPSEDMADIITPLPSARPAYHKYSTEEQIVGEWIDGKPIYQKTLNLTTPSSTTDWVQLADVSSLNIDTFIYGYGFIKTANDFIIPVPSAWSSTSTVNANFNFGFITGELWCCLLSPNGNWAGKPLTITIQYTKTT